ncbi:uncharacterized protein CCOS01_06791 [Colletotrichum costaricense]|uniref:Uncharacterized protein n=1 Tax=Colletotrichum costaricense TaxID=1209916 RepID=A0AAJ0E275_9PEZI|nr:uncharacterized protein CCOS01_06791 [Colletotrichum costaricense]KAK1528957.1 hypothetical protein CCOS01_06791 [Colletotrichum costaricense]
MPYRPMRALQLGAPTRLSAQCQRASVGSRPFSQATRGPREEKSTTPTACLHSVHKGGKTMTGGDGIPQVVLDSQVQQQRRHPIHHRTLPHPPAVLNSLWSPGTSRSSPRLSASPDSGHLLRPFPTASPEDPSLSPTSELLPPLSQLALSDSVSAGLGRQNPVIISEVVLPGTDVLSSRPPLPRFSPLVIVSVVQQPLGLRKNETVDVVSSAVFAGPPRSPARRVPRSLALSTEHLGLRVSGSSDDSERSLTGRPAIHSGSRAVSVLMRLFSQHYWSGRLFPAVASAGTPATCFHVRTVQGHLTQCALSSTRDWTYPSVLPCNTPSTPFVPKVVPETCLVGNGSSSSPAWGTIITGGVVNDPEPTVSWPERSSCAGNYWKAEKPCLKPDALVKTHWAPREFSQAMWPWLLRSISHRSHSKAHRHPASIYIDALEANTCTDAWDFGHDAVLFFDNYPCSTELRRPPFL